MTIVAAQPHYLTIKDVVARMALSQSAIYRLVQRGEFPPPHHLTLQARRWLSSDIDEFIEARAAGRAWSPKVSTLARSRSK